MIPGPACVWYSKPQLGQKNEALLLALHLISKRLSMESQACTDQNTFHQTSGWKNRQVIHWLNRATGKHVFVGQCCFDAKSPEYWFEGSSNREFSIVSLPQGLPPWRSTCCGGGEACEFWWPLELHWRECELLVGSPVPDRSKGRSQTKCSPLVLQVGGWAWR
jgi:hypothetical protein